MPSNGRIWGLIADTTSVSPSKFDESGLSPWCSPRVLNVPIIWGHSNQKGRVIELSITVRENSTFVLSPLWGIDINRNWLIGNGISEVIAAWNISEFINVVISTINCTVLIMSFIWVSIFGGQSFIDDIIESTVCVSYFASLISIGLRTINKLLFRKIDRMFLE